MVPTLPSNNSSQQLVENAEENSEDVTITRDSTSSTSSPNSNSKTISVKQWIVVIILCFVNLINYMDRFTLAGILDDIQKYFDIQDDKAGLLQTSFVLTYMLFAPIFGYLGDRYSRKNIMAAGVFLWSLTTFLGSFMSNFWWFIFFRALVGIGEASYSTIAPTIISDLFVDETRTKVLTIFYFAIPVGSGLGYIVGSEIAKLTGSWYWALRCTPVLGIIAVVLIIFILDDPERGQSESHAHLKATAWREDLIHLVKNKSFMLSTAGFTCVSFVAGSLAWWGPKLIYLGFQLQNNGPIDKNNLSFIFGVITMSAGIVGICSGFVLSKSLRTKFPKADPIICGIGLLLSAPLLFAATFVATRSDLFCYLLLLTGEVTLNLNWAICGDILLYVVIPTRRSTAEGFQLLIAHALGDAGSPFLIGVVSESLKSYLRSSSNHLTSSISAASVVLSDTEVEFRALQYALFSTCFVEIFGGIFFLINALYIVKDKKTAENAVKDQLTITGSMEPEMNNLLNS